MALLNWSKRLQKFDHKIFSFFTAQIAGIFLWLHEFRAIDDAQILRPILQNGQQVGCEMLHTGHHLGVCSAAWVRIVPGAPNPMEYHGISHGIHGSRPLFIVSLFSVIPCYPMLSHIWGRANEPGQ